MERSDDRDEDEVLDEQHEAVHKAIERGDPLPLTWTEDDRAFIEYAEKRLSNDESKA
jgi:hypothetical protein